MVIAEAAASTANEIDAILRHLIPVLVGAKARCPVVAPTPTHPRMATKALTVKKNTMEKIIEDFGRAVGSHGDLPRNTVKPRFPNTKRKKIVGNLHRRHRPRPLPLIIVLGLRDQGCP